MTKIASSHAYGKTSVAVSELADGISKHISQVNGVPVIDPTAYMATLSEGVTPEMINAVHAHNNLFYPAAALAFGQAAAKSLKKDSDLDKVKIEIPMVDKDSFALTYERSRSFPAIKRDGEAQGEPSVTHGFLSASLTTQAARGSIGEFNKVRDFLSEEALKAYSK